MKNTILAALTGLLLGFPTGQHYERSRPTPAITVIAPPTPVPLPVRKEVPVTYIATPTPTPRGYWMYDPEHKRALDKPTKK